MTIYLTKAFGLEGFYQWNFKERSNLAADIEGSVVEGMIFIDYSLLRVFGAWSLESRTRTDVATGVKSERKRDVIDFGAKLFF